ncbi:arrestin domain-containing protein 3-like [Gigantopelta aegis]|uniref:arrestin domain-containing protein 3-like n=1 Tax=Gigantopelta aegis TaxID=1735272 RepID=UPI001B8888AA|nr:arrestin domain-containing protein 3-like [Gigantopelta aegis]
MGKLKSGSILLDGNKEVYRRGDTVKGTVVLEVTEALTVKSVRVCLFGQTLVKWDEFNGKTTKDYISKENYLGHVVTVFGKRADETGPNVTLTAGNHRLRFIFVLPKEGNFPSSFEGEYGAIRFWLKMEVAKPFPGINKTWYRCITYLSDININQMMYKSPKSGRSAKTISKFLGFGDAGTLTLAASTDRGAYCPGEKIALSVIVKNNSSKDLGRLNAHFIQTVQYLANNDTKERTSIFRAIGGEPVEKGGEQKWLNKHIQVDAIPPTTKPSTCHVILVKYHIKIFVEVPWGFNLEVWLPITIGTIPLGHSTRSTQGATASSFETDASSAITYSKCNKGVQRCSKSEGNFVNISYVPMCPYVVNYVFKPPSARPANQRVAQGARPRTTDQPTANTASVFSEKATIVATPPAREPTAPPSEEPPSYEEVLRMDNPDPDEIGKTGQKKPDA